MKNPTLIHTDGDKLLIVFFFVFSLFTYVLVCAILMECFNFVNILLFVSLSGVLFAYMKYVHPGTHYLRIFMQTLLIMEVIVHFIFVFVIFVYPNNNAEKRDIDTEEKKAGATKSIKKGKDMNYASMADTDVLIENIVINV